MTVLKIIAIVFTGAGLMAALVAAKYWLDASRVFTPPTAASISDAPEIYIMGVQVDAYKTNELNAKAAIWTAGAAVLSTLGSLIGTL